MIVSAARVVVSLAVAAPLPVLIRPGSRTDRALDRLLVPAACAAVDLIEATEGLLQRLRDRSAGRCPEAPDGRHTWEDIRYNGLWLGQACADCTAGRKL